MDLGGGRLGGCNARIEHNPTWVLEGDVLARYRSLKATRCLGGTLEQLQRVRMIHKVGDVTLGREEDWRGD